jgi:hypothetical protein
MTMGNEMTPTLPGSASRSTRLPILVDICLSVSQIIIFLVAVTTAILSILANADFLTIILRTAVAIVCVGIPVYVLNYLFGRYYVEATVDSMEKAIRATEARRNLDNSEHGELEAKA